MINNHVKDVALPFMFLPGLLEAVAAENISAGEFAEVVFADGVFADGVALGSIIGTSADDISKDKEINVSSDGIVIRYQISTPLTEMYEKII